MKILSCGAGMQSTALVLMSCENKLKGIIHERVPIYDAVLFCDLGEEPAWVYKQVKFIAKQCKEAEIPFYILDSNLFEDYMDNFGKKRVSSIPFWSINKDGKKGKMLRACTLDYKINTMQKFVRWELLGYKKGERTKQHDLKAHEMHLGFSYEEKRRCKENPHKMFVNKFPLVEMNLTRADNYKYILETWGLDTKASACTICPFHTNFFFKYIKDKYEDDYKKVLAFDDMLQKQQPNTKIESKLYLSKSRKPIKDLTDDECRDYETFKYRDRVVWNGF
ncbi:MULTISPECIES: hypothetical protein [unclassified Breznakia]|uniref:hypothetical protein n=1 Tax=unclassified Breznakia TaxID=2623764 RepID=UPI002473EE4F|nr:MULTISPECIES: hypothetical protein [unclassified Breznakia]MDH6367059.1 hypothetical protein [Breznakia sp. PH1-1]MDH6404169.1 hypothetical protein [Breznakia sp. PF1-11]MDH6411946.1 hypothetical protein [Breznakia sp. PFB1-11]MDH6414157.1 hypothetical protein [Breznakia sp. PFB1-14]MDH6418910.1 hypothetical protein [Breznakia sp. PFB1-12]